MKFLAQFEQVALNLSLFLSQNNGDDIWIVRVAL
jgi:hypothetical protein